MKSTIDALLVEDSCSDAQLVQAIVNSSELEKPQLHHAERFDQALMMLAKSTFDVVLLDLNLPDGQGLHLLEQLKQLAPTIPIVVLTGVRDQTIAMAALQAGAQDYVVKSDTFSPDRLAQLGYTQIGNSLVQRIQYAIKRAASSKQLDPSQERYALIAQGASDGIWDWNLKTNRIYYSPHWQSLLGLSNDSDSPNEWLSRIHPDDRDSFERELQAYLNRQQQRFHCEYRVRHTNGDYLWVLTRGIALWDHSGRAYRLVGSQTDMTLRVTLENSPQQQQEIAQTTLHYIGIGLMSNLGEHYLADGRYGEAEPLLQSALVMRKWLLGNTHLDVALSLYRLATLYDNQGHYNKASLLFREALSLVEKKLGPEHPDTKVLRLQVSLIKKMNQTLEI